MEPGLDGLDKLPDMANCKVPNQICSGQFAIFNLHFVICHLCSSAKIGVIRVPFLIDLTFAAPALPEYAANLP